MPGGSDLKDFINFQPSGLGTFTRNLCYTSMPQYLTKFRILLKIADNLLEFKSVRSINVEASDIFILQSVISVLTLQNHLTFAHNKVWISISDMFFFCTAIHIISLSSQLTLYCRLMTLVLQGLLFLLHFSLFKSINHLTYFVNCYLSFLICTWQLT